MEKIKCDKCGESISKTAKFCSNCGALIEKKEVEGEKEFLNTQEKEQVVEVTKKDLPEKTIKSNNFGVIILTAFLTCIISIGCCLLVYSLKEPITNEVIKEQKNVTVTDTGIADAVEKVFDSVVVIKTYKGDKLYGSATGFVFEKDDKVSYIMTNAHVIYNGDKFTATFTNKKTADLKLVGSDTYADIAVLSVDSDSIISVADIGSSDILRLGDTLFTVGAPIDPDSYSWSVTRGVLSGKNREVEVSANDNYFSNESFIMEVLQTDAPINSGNSGGPLCNANGEVIGVTNMKLSSSTIEGISFAIPIETAMEYASTFITGKQVTRPYVGIAMYYVSPTLYRNVKASGLYIQQVEENSAAFKAGLKEGDIITKIGGKDVQSVAYFRYLLYKYDIGDKVEFTIMRNDKEKKIIVTLDTSSPKS